MSRLQHKSYLFTHIHPSQYNRVLICMTI